MHEKDIERFAYLYLCGQKDKDLLSGKIKMTFQEFSRIVYITDTLGFDHLNMEIWNEFSSRFAEQLEALEALDEELPGGMEPGGYEEDDGLRDRWAAEFCAAAPDEQTREFLKKVFEGV